MRRGGGLSPFIPARAAVQRERPPSARHRRREGQDTRQAVFRALRAPGVPEAEPAGRERTLSTFVCGFAASEAGGRFGGLNTEAEFDDVTSHIETLIEAAAAHGPGA